MERDGLIEWLITWTQQSKIFKDTICIEQTTLTQ